MSSKIIATGSYAPSRILTNYDLEKMVDTNDEWIRKRTGIISRNISDKDEYTTDLAIKAALQLKNDYPDAIKGVGQIIVASMTPDYYCPNISSLIQAELGLDYCGVIDINCACSGFVYALMVGNGLIASKAASKVLVVGADAMSKIIDYQDRSTCILFGDGAGAVILEAAEKSDFLAYFNQSHGQDADTIYCNGLSNKMGDHEPFFSQKGNNVFQWAVTEVSKGIRKILDDSDFLTSQVDWFILHSANGRILDAVAKKVGIDRERILSSHENHGNTSSASIPIAFDKNVKSGKIKNGNRVLLYGFGGGLTQAGVLLQLNGIGNPD